MHSKLSVKFFTIILTFVLAPAVFGQATGGLSGTVSDPNGAIIQGATVTVKNTATNLTRTAQANHEGRWTGKSSSGRPIQRFI